MKEITAKIVEKTQVNIYHSLSLLFCLIFIVSNVAAIKICTFHSIYLDAGTLYFPILYVISDIVTEVYGFKASCKMMWLAIGANICFTVLMYITVKLPNDSSINVNAAFNKVFAFSPRILIASIVSFLIGIYINSALLSIMKIKLRGKLFVLRAIVSTIISSAFIESTLFVGIAFYGIMSTEDLIGILITLAAIKILYELIAIPMVNQFVTHLKEKEGLDHYG